MHFLIEISIEGNSSRISIKGDAPQISVVKVQEGKFELIDGVDGRRLLCLASGKIEVDAHCDRQIFFRKNGASSVLVSSSPKMLFVNNEASANQNYFVQYLFCGAMPSNITPFEDIYYLQPGSYLEINGFVVGLEAKSHPGDKSFIEVFEGSINKNLRSKKNITVEFSGGLESSVMLHAIRACDYQGRVKLIHITDSETGEADDLKSVKEAASEFGYELVVIDQCEVPPFQIKSCSTVLPNFAHSGLVNIGYIDIVSEIISESSSVLLNGSGGDSIFCAQPQTWLPIELIRSGRLIKALDNLLHLSSYYRTSIVPMAVRSMKDYTVAT